MDRARTKAGMMPDCLGCLAIETHPVTLHDGRVVCHSCEFWRMECEARETLTKPLAQRRAYLEGVEEKRGKEATDALKAVISALWVQS